MIVPVPQFTAPGYLDRSANNVQRVINLYPEQTPNGTRLISFPGYTLLATATNNAGCRGAYFSSSGKLFSLHGSTLYEVSSTGTFTSRGTVSGSSGTVQFADNGTQLFLVEPASKGYTLTMSSGSVTQITDVNFPSAPTGAAFMDGYFITAQNGTGVFYLSQLNDGTDWTPSQFATAEYAGDNIVNLIRMGHQVYIFGARSIEAWYDTGNPAFPFEPVNGLSIDVGLGAQYSLASIAGTAYFLGASSTGNQAIHALSGGAIKKISTPFLESVIAAGYPPSWVGCCAYLDGHPIYEISNITTGGSYVYFIDAGVWMERLAIGTASNIRPFLNAFTSAGEPPLVFSASNGALYEVRPNVNTEAGSYQSRLKTFGPIVANGKKVFHKQIRIEGEITFDGTGTTTISASLVWTDDGGITFPGSATLSATTTSSTTTQRFVWVANRLGHSKERYYSLSLLNGPAGKLVLKSCELDLEEGRF